MVPTLRRRGPLKLSDENSTAAGLSLLCGTVAVGPAAALGVMGPTGSTPVPPALPLWPLSEAARKEWRSGADDGALACVKEIV